MGFEANHEPFLGTLQEGSSIQIKDASLKEKEITIASGMFIFKDNTCTISALQA